MVALLARRAWSRGHGRGHRNERRRPAERRGTRDAPAKAGRCGARERGPRGDVPDDRIGGEGRQPAAGILRARDLAGEPLSVRCGRAGDAQRPARAGHRAVHAGHRQRAAAARSLRSRAGAAEIRRIPWTSCATSSAISGLAAAAYNAGPRRVQEWLAGTGHMPQETRNYVVAITGSTRRGLGQGGTQRQDAGARRRRRVAAN